MFVPCCIPYVFPGLKIPVSPKMVHHVQLPNLREESSDGFITILSEADRTSPVIAPFNHGSWSELVRPEFIYIRAWSWDRLIPETELQQELILPGEKHVTSCLTKFQKFLIFSEFIHDFCEGWIASFIPPEVDSLVLLAIPRVPSPHQSTRVVFIFVNLWQHLLTNFVVCF